MIISKREQRMINEQSEPFKHILQKIVEAKDEELPKVLDSYLKWDDSRTSLASWIPALNKLDAILEQILTRNGLLDKYVKPQELNQFDTTLTLSILSFTKVLLENSTHSSIYSSSHRLYDLLRVPSTPIIIGCLSCLILLNKKKQLSDRVLPLALILPSSTSSASTGSNENLKLSDFLNDSAKIPHKWKYIDLLYYGKPASKHHITGSQDNESPLKKHTSHQNQHHQKETSPAKKKTPSLNASQKTDQTSSSLHFYVSEHEVKKLSVQQLCDKAVMKIPQEYWNSVCLKALVAKAFNGSSFENLKLREDLLKIKCLAITFLVKFNDEFTLAAELFEADPSILQLLIHIIDLQNSFSKDLRLSAVQSLDVLSKIKSWASEIVRELGASVSHGLLYQNLNNMLIQLKNDQEDKIDDRFNATYLNVIFNLASSRSLANILVSAGILNYLIEFLTVRTTHRTSLTAAAHLIPSIISKSTEYIEIFKANNGFTTLIERLGYEIKFAMENPGYGGGAPKLAIVHYSITFRQASYIRSLLSLAHSVIVVESGDRARNLFDSPLLGHVNQILSNVSTFGYTLLTLSLNVIISIIHNDPTSYPILKEAGTFDIIFENFENFFGISAELSLALPNVIGAIALNTEGLKLVQEHRLIERLFKIFYISKCARALVLPEETSLFSSSIEELSRHHPVLKPIVQNETIQILKRLPDYALQNLPKPKLYKDSNDLQLYHSKDDVISEDEKDDTIDPWESVDQVFIIENITVFLNCLIMSGTSDWSSLMNEIPFEDWIPLLDLRSATYDYPYSETMTSIIGILKDFESKKKAYSCKGFINAIESNLKEFDQFLSFDFEKSIFLELESLKEFEKSDQLLSLLIGINALLFAFANIFCASSSLMSERTKQVAKELSSEKGLKIIEKLGKLLQRVTAEEYKIRLVTPKVIDDSTIPHSPLRGLPPLRIADHDNFKDFERKEYKTPQAKNLIQLRVLFQRIHTSISLIFNTVLIVFSSDRHETTDDFKSEKAHNAQQVINVFIDLLYSKHEDNPGLMLTYIFTIHYCLTDNHSDKTLTLGSILFMQSGGFKKEAEILQHYWEKLKLLDYDKIKNVKELTYVPNNEEDITVAIVMNILVFVEKVTRYENLQLASNIPLFYEGDFYGSINFEIHNITGCFLVQTKLFAFGLISTIFDEEKFDSFDESFKLPDPVVYELVKIIKHVFSTSGEKYLDGSDGSLFEIQWEQARPSKFRIDYLESLGLSHETSRELILSSCGDFSMLEEEEVPIGIESDELTEEVWREVIQRAKQSPYNPPNPEPIQPHYKDYNTIIDLEQLRESKSSYFLDQALLICQLYPKSVASVSDLILSTTLLSPQTNIFTFMNESMEKILQLIYSFPIEAEECQGLESLLELLYMLFSNNSVFIDCHSALESFMSYVISVLKPEHVNFNWFARMVMCTDRIIAGSNLPDIEKVSVPATLPPIKPFNPYWKLPAGKMDKLFNVFISTGEITNPLSAAALTRSLIIFSQDPDYSLKITKSGFFSKTSNALAGCFEKLDPKENSTLAFEKLLNFHTTSLLLARRCFETKDLLKSLISKEITRNFKSRINNRLINKDLQQLLKDSISAVLRSPEIYVDELVKQARFVEFQENLKNLALGLIEEEKKIITEEEQQEKEDVIMGHTSAEVCEAGKTSFMKLKEADTGIIHVILTKLMSVSKKDWISDPKPTEEELKEEAENKKRHEFPKTKKPDINKNPTCRLIIYLLKVLVELLASYKQSKFEFLTFSKKQLFQSEITEAPKPRSTSLNFLLHQFLQHKVPDSDLSDAEKDRRNAVFKNASLVVTAFISSVDDNDRKSYKDDPKSLDPDMIYIRKFTVDCIHKIMKDCLISANHSTTILYQQLANLSNVLHNLLTTPNEKCFDKFSVEEDCYHFAKVCIETNVPQTFSAILAELDVNHPSYEYVSQGLLRTLSTIADIKHRFGEYFKKDQPNGAFDEEEVEDEGEEDETPNIFRNSTLGMYDVDEIDSEEEDSEELEDEDIGSESEDSDDDLSFEGNPQGRIEIVYSEDEDEDDDGEDEDEDLTGDEDEDVIIGGSDDDGEGIIVEEIHNDHSDGSNAESGSESDIESEGSLIYDENGQLVDEYGYIDSEDGEEVIDDEDDVGSFEEDEDGLEVIQDDDDDISIIDENEELDGFDNRHEVNDWFDSLSESEGGNSEEEQRNHHGVHEISRSSQIPARLAAHLMRHHNEQTDFHGRHDSGHNPLLVNLTDSRDLNGFYEISTNGQGLRAFEHISDLLKPFSANRYNSDLTLSSTRERWNEAAAMLYNRNSDGLRLVPAIINRLYQPSFELFEKKRIEREEKLKQEEEERKKKEAEEEERRKQEEAERAQRQEESEGHNSHHEDHEPVMVTIGNRQVDIGGTDIDPEFIEALPDYMRQEVLAQHIRERRQEATEHTVNSREIDEEFLNALPDSIRHEIMEQEMIARREAEAQAAVRAMGAQNGNSTTLETNQEPSTTVTINVNNNSNNKKDGKSKVFFSPLIDRFGVASIVRSVYVPQPFERRRELYQLYGEVCYSKQTRAELFGLLLAILQDGISNQQSLEKTFYQITSKAKVSFNLINGPAGNKQPTTPSKTAPNTPQNIKSTPTSSQLGSGSPQFPAASTPFIVTSQILEGLQVMLEFDSHFRYYFLTEHEPIVLNKKSGLKKREIFNKTSKYPLNILLNLLNKPAVKEKASTLDTLSRLIQINTRPLIALKKAMDDENQKKPIEMPEVSESSFDSIVSILTSDHCTNRTFLQTISAMQNMLVLKNSENKFAVELSKLASKLSTTITKDLKDLIESLKEGIENQETDELMKKFTLSSSDQAKLLRIITALDYLFGEGNKNKSSKDKFDLTKLYDELNLGLLWAELSECLDLLEKETKKKTDIATILLPLIEALMVVCQHSKVKEYQSRELFKIENSKYDFTNEPIENLFFTFTDRHKKMLNKMVRSNPKLMGGPFAMLVKNPKVLEFDNKKNYFDRKLHNDKQEDKQLNVTVRRDQVFLDSYRSLFFKSKEEFRDSKLNITFKGEVGVDAGGVTREWYQVLSRQMFNPDYALFLPVESDKTTFHPNRTSGVNPEHLSFFKFIGRIIGKAIYDGCYLDCHFTRDVYKSILGRKVSLKDLESIDLDYYKSLIWMLENDITDIIIETFSIETDDYGEKKVIELVPNGENIAVTEENKQEYVKLVVEYRLQKSVIEQMDNFLQGFHEMIPKELISIFDEQELELLISGLPDIDVDDWKNNTNYVNYTQSSNEISYFWRAVRSFDTEERAKLLQFATGTSKVPLNGFKDLKGSNGSSKFSIHRDFGPTTRLPSSHTCFNQIDLPAYGSYDTLRRALLLAITEGHEGFGLA